MIDDFVPLVGFALIAFTAIAVPSLLATVLFGHIRKDGESPTEFSKRIEMHPRLGTRVRSNRWYRE